MPMTASSGKSRLLRAGFRTGTRRRRRVAEEGFSSLGRGEYPYDVEFNASAKMLRFRKLFHLSKHSSLLNLVNLK
jgi:hypothetical protein